MRVCKWVHVILLYLLSDYPVLLMLPVCFMVLASSRLKLTLVQLDCQKRNYGGLPVALEVKWCHGAKARKVILVQSFITDSISIALTIMKMYTFHNLLIL